LHVKFSYNKTFYGGTKYSAGRKEKVGSWTKSLRPDYTLSIWPEEYKDENEAEELEKIVHIHFDSKYKVQQFTIKTNVEQDVEDKYDEGSSLEKNCDVQKIDSLEKEKREERRGIYKNADLLKMHAYKDAIRRTGGAYILYPGSNNPINPNNIFYGFHEIIPGLGAFAIRPQEGENGSTELGVFIDKVIEHFKNAASQQRRHSNKIYEIHKDDTPNIVKEPLPDNIIPDETFVLIGFYKDEQHLNWITSKRLYNTRAGSVRGSLRLNPSEVGAKFLLLHTNGELVTSKLFKIRESEPRIFSRKTLEKINYPHDPDKQDQYYLVYKIDEVQNKQFLDTTWDITKLDRFKKGRNSVLPFSVTLSALMKAKVK
jgi:hypothetical protein